MASDGTMSPLTSEPASFEHQVMAYLQGLKTDMQSMSSRLEKVEKDHEESKTSPPRPAQRALTDTVLSTPRETSSSNSLSWAEMMDLEDEQQLMDDCEVSKSEQDGGEEHDAKGIRLFPTSERTESFLRPLFASPLPNSTRRQLRERFGSPNLPFTAAPHLDKVLKSRLPAATKSKDKELAKLQALALDAVGPLCKIVEDAHSGQLTARDNLDAVQTSLKLLGNLSAQCNRIRRTAILQSLNPRIADMAEEDEVYRNAGLNLFGEGFCRKAKERDEEMKALSSLGAGSSGARDHTRRSTDRPFFPRPDHRGGKHRQRFPSGRGRTRFVPYHQSATSRKDEPRK